MNKGPIDFIFEDAPSQEMSKRDLAELGNRRKRERQRYKQSSTYNEVPIIPVDEETLAEREKYSNDYVLALQELFPNSTGLKPFCPDQIRSIRASEHVINHGGNVIKCEPRGFGKTTRAVGEALLAILQGKIRYVLILASEVTKAQEILDIIKTNIWSNDKLYELYQPTIECFRSLDGKPGRASLQTYGGNHTHIVWGMDELVFPCIPGEASSGCIIRVKSKSNVRGVIYAPKDGPYSGEVLRPELVVADDIQKDDEARNPETVRKMVETMNKAVLMSGSHSKPISCIMTATPQEENDFPSQYMYYEPDFSRIKYSMMHSLPTNMHLWLGEYSEILTSYDKDNPSDILRARRDALKYYKEHREEMDEGAEAAWEWAYAWAQKSRYEISATQHAMNIIILKGEDLFETECQTNVRHRHKNLDDVLASPDIIRSKTQNYPELVVPLNTKRIVAHIDVNQEVLSYMVAACPLHIEPHIITYGTWPDQGRGWSKTKLIFPLSQRYGGPTVEAKLKQALVELIEMLSSPYLRSDNVKVSIDRIGIDRGRWADLIYEVCDMYPVCVPVLGEGILAKDRPMAQRAKGRGDTYYNYCMMTTAYHRHAQDLRVDTNWYKDFVHKGLRTPAFQPDAITFFEGDHIEVSNHVHSEKPEMNKCEKTGRSRNLWKHIKRNHPNEYLDNLVGCLALLNSSGCDFGVARSHSEVYDFNEAYETELNF